MAFTIIYDKYHKELYAFAYKYVRDHAAAEDVVQHTFVKLWEIRRKLNPCLSINGYIYSIAKNHTLNTIRNSKSRAVKNMEYHNDIGKFEEPPMSDTGGAEMVGLLDKAIKQLPPQRMAICRMKIAEGMSNQEIADQLGISVSTVKNQYTTSIKQLRSIMGVSMAVAVFLSIIPPV